MGGTIPNNLFTLAPPALEFMMDGETWIIPANFFVSSQQSFGVFSDKIGSSLINSGTVFGGFDGVAFNVMSSGGAITNNAGGTIVGHNHGVVFSGPNAALTNHGTVWGLVVAGVYLDGSLAFVVNDGEIRGPDAGIEVHSAGAAIRNSGLIRSNLDGILIDTGGGLTTIDNFAAGTITGFSLAVHTVSGAISVDNRGTIAGAILCQASNANDSVTNSGKIIGEIFLGSGSDSFNGAGGTSGKVFGDSGNDTLIGGSANDILDGGAGVDTVRGGRGKDQLSGGPERDIFDFNSIAESKLGASRDFIADFQRGTNITGDDIDLSTIDARTGLAGNQAFKFIGTQTFHKVKGELHYKDLGASCLVQGDVNGDGKADFEILLKAAALAAGDFLL